MELKQIKIDSSLDVLEKWAKLQVENFKEIFPRFPSDPPKQYLLNLQTNSNIDHDKLHFLIYVEQKIMGFASIRINKITNLDLSSIYIYIIKHRRLEGNAKSTLKQIINWYLPKNISKLSFRVVRDNPEIKLALEKYLEDLGAKLVYSERRNVSEFNNFNLKEVKETVDKLEQKAIQKGYRLVEILKDPENYPEIDFTQFTSMLERIWNDMPIEDAEWEEEVLTESMLREMINELKKSKLEFWAYVVVDRDKTPVGLTNVVIPLLNPSMVWQGDTGVLAEHRGNRLGKTLKYKILYKLLTDPLSENASIWVTGNANSNKYMLAINKELNYSEWYRELYYEITVDELVKNL